MSESVFSKFARNPELEIERREARAEKMAERFKDLRGLTYEDFLVRCLDEGFDFDFITSVSLHKEINK